MANKTLVCTIAALTLLLSACSSVKPHFQTPTKDSTVGPPSTLPEAIAYAESVQLALHQRANDLSGYNNFLGQSALVLGTGAAAAAAFDAGRDWLAGLGLGSAFTFAQRSFAQPLQKAAVYDQAILAIQCAINEATTINDQQARIDQLSKDTQGLASSVKAVDTFIATGNNEIGRISAMALGHMQGRATLAAEELERLPVKAMLLNAHVRRAQVVKTSAEKTIRLVSQLDALSDTAATKLVNSVQQIQIGTSIMFRDLDRQVDLKELADISIADEGDQIAEESGEVTESLTTEPNEAAQTMQWGIAVLIDPQSANAMTMTPSLAALGRDSNPDQVAHETRAIANEANSIATLLTRARCGQQSNPGEN